MYHQYINRNIKVSDQEKRKMNKNCDKIQELVNPKKSQTKKKEISVQEGGAFLAPSIAPVLRNPCEKRLSHKRRKKSKFNVGDFIRLSIENAPFMKRYQEIWSEEVFSFDAIVYGNPTTYKLKDQDNEPIKGTFYEQDLQLIVKPKTYHIAKIFERVIYNSLFNHFQSNNFFTSSQSGLLPGDTCIASLLSNLREIQTAFDNNPTIDVYFVTYQKPLTKPGIEVFYSSYKLMGLKVNYLPYLKIIFIIVNKE